MLEADSATYWEWVTFRAEEIAGQVHYSLTFMATGMIKQTTVALGSHAVGHPPYPSLELFLKATMADHVENVIHHSVSPF
jgi:hypothetical protein